jgi:hypothetical protein
MRRRTVIQVMMGALTARPRYVRSAVQPPFGDTHRTRLLALAAAVLPTEIGDAGHAGAVDQFLRWVEDYRPGAEMDHGYGATRPRVTAPSPAAGYLAQLDDLDTRAGGSLAARTVSERQQAIAAALEAAKITALPRRPNGGHVAADLMAHYFRGAAANDLAYRRAIGRDACRGLAGSADRPAALPAAEKA